LIAFDPDPTTKGTDLTGSDRIHNTAIFTFLLTKYYYREIGPKMLEFFETYFKVTIITCVS
jgi:hypothetical protein